jgi:hypothetical protein
VQSLFLPETIFFENICNLIVNEAKLKVATDDGSCQTQTQTLTLNVIYKQLPSSILLGKKIHLEKMMMSR